MNRKWNEYRKVLKIIGKYYSREQYGSPEYLHSKEYKRYKKILEDKALFKKKQKEYYDMLRTVFPHYYVQRWDNMTYPCLQFSILLHKDQPILDDDVELMDALGGKRYNLDVFISRISNYYYACTFEHIYNPGQDFEHEWMFDSHGAAYALKKKYLKRLKREMKKKGVSKLSRAVAHSKVPFIETELLPRDKYEVRVFNCLFSDMVIDYY